MSATEPDASGEIEIEAGTGKVFAVLTDLDTLAGLAGEYTGHRWLGRAERAAVGAKFVGFNRRGWRRWFTFCTITDADDGRRFAFDVNFGPLPISRWQYDIEPAGEISCRVTESTWNREPGWFRPVAKVVIGPKDRAEQNRVNILATLSRLKQRAETG